jgi:hypothetical protein
VGGLQSFSWQVAHTAPVEDWKHELIAGLENHSNYHAVSHGLGMGVE